MIIKQEVVIAIIVILVVVILVNNNVVLLSPFGFSGQWDYEIPGEKLEFKISELKKNAIHFEPTKIASLDEDFIGIEQRGDLLLGEDFVDIENGEEFDYDYKIIQDSYIVVLGPGIYNLDSKQRIFEKQRIKRLESEISIILKKPPKGSAVNTINAIFLEKVSTDELRRAVELVKRSYPMVQVFPDTIKKPSLMDSVPLIEADEVHELGFTGEGIVVSVIDTGIDYTHEDLGGCTEDEFLGGDCTKYTDGYDFYNDDENPMDDRGHGTHVAATVAGSGSLTGVAPDAQIAAYKVCSSGGSCPTSDIIAALERTVDPNGDGEYDDRADIMSMSLGGPGNPGDPDAIAVDALVEIGTVAVIAAGNDWSGADYQDIDCPGCAISAITAGATQKDDDLTYFSMKGPIIYDSTVYVKPTVVAPGNYICSAQWDDAYDWADTDCNDDDNHVAIRGTSMATPHVSGAAALLLQASGDLTAEQIKSVLIQGAEDIGEDVFSQGGGRINVLNSLNQEVIITPSPINLPVYDPSTTSDTVEIYVENIIDGVVGIEIEEIEIIDIVGEDADSEILDVGLTLCVDADSTESVEFDLDLSELETGIYSGKLKINVFDDCDFTSDPSDSMTIPMGFAIMYPLTINYVGTPPESDPSEYFLYHNNNFMIQGENDNSKYWNYVYGSDEYENSYTIYTPDSEVDFFAAMLERSYYPDYDYVNVNYFIDHIDLEETSEITLEETEATHIEQNLVETIEDNSLNPVGYYTKILRMEDYYNSFLIGSPLDISVFEEIDFGISASNLDSFIYDDYGLFLALYGIDEGETYETTQNSIILPLAFEHPIYYEDKTILDDDVKSISISIPETLNDYFNENTRFGIGAYSPNNYGYPGVKEFISIPRFGTFYYLDGCFACHYLFAYSIWDSSTDNNAYIWANYFDGNARYVPETNDRKPSSISYFEEPLALELRNEHCIEYLPGTFYFCGDDLIRGYILENSDRERRDSITWDKSMTEDTSGELIIRTPSGSTYDIFSDDNSVLPFGRFGPWNIDCTSPVLSHPDILEEDEFCLDGDYEIYWEIDDLLNEGTLKMYAEVTHERDSFNVKTICQGEPSQLVADFVDPGAITSPGGDPSEYSFNCRSY